MPLIKRLRALDLFRGLTVVGMILVNSSGSDDVFRLMDHAPWNGLTFADFVFPSFLVIVGVSAAYSHAARRARPIGGRHRGPRDPARGRPLRPRPPGQLRRLPRGGRGALAGRPAAHRAVLGGRDGL